MCDDLIAAHFFNASLNGSTRIPTQTPDAHIFVQHSPLNRLWLFLPASIDVARVDAWLAEHLRDLDLDRYDGWSVNSFDKGVALKLYKQWRAASLDLLYEMRLRVPTPPGASACPSGFTIREDPAYLKAHNPEHVFDAFLRTETTFTVVEDSSGEVAGFATFLADDTTKRVYISSIEIFPAYRRRGLAKALMAQTRQWEEKQYAVWLTVFAENVGAVAMYFSVGFGVERCMWVVAGGKP